MFPRAPPANRYSPTSRTAALLHLALCAPAHAPLTPWHPPPICSAADEKDLLEEPTPDARSAEPAESGQSRGLDPTGDKPKAKPRLSSSGGGGSSGSHPIGGGSSGSHPILRQTDEAQLQPLAEAEASKDGLKGAAAARATLAERVSAELALSIGHLQVGLALEMARHHILLAEYEAHWGTACMIKMLARAKFLFRTSGRTMHMSPPTRKLPEGLGEPNPNPNPDPNPLPHPHPHPNPHPNPNPNPDPDPDPNPNP